MIAERPTRFWFAGALAACLACLALSVAAAEYRLAAGDTLRISVHGRSDLTGQYAVRPSGSISFPLLGVVQLDGLTLEETEGKLQQALDAALTQHHSVNVSLVGFRPFFIDGDVSSPGAFPYRSGLNVMQAIAIAGGRQSARAFGETSAQERDRQRERLDLELLDYKADVAREARLLAERSDATEIAFPADLLERAADDERVAEIVANERHIFETRQEGFIGQITILEQRLIENQEQHKALIAQNKTSEKRLRIAKEQFADAKDLAKTGAISRVAVTQQELSLMGVETEVRNVAVRIVQAKLSISSTRQAIVNLRTQRASGIAEQLGTLQRNMSSARIRIGRLANRLSGGVEEPAPRLPDGLDAIYRISRTTPGGIEEIEAHAHTEVEPGDVLRVPFPEPADSEDLGIDLPQRASKR